MSKYLSSRLSALESYVPGEQPQDRKYIKLNTNESPFPPAPSVAAAVTEGRARDLQLYCDPECGELTALIAAQYGVGRENVITGNGSDEILSYCFSAYFDKSSPVLFPDITYGFYEVFGDLYGSDYEKIPLRDDLTADVSDYAGAGKNVVIANPNAPTGVYLPPDDIEKIVSSNPDNIVVIDEAYIDFGGQSAAPLTKKYKNLIVTMTFSKSRSLAGARLGFAIADAALIDDLRKIKYSQNPYNVNSLTQAAGCAVLREQEYYDKNCEKIIATRERFCKELAALGFDFPESRANFVFAGKPGADGETLYKKLREKGVLVRHFSSPRIKDRLRITIGTDAQMDALIRALKEIL